MRNATLDYFACTNIMAVTRVLGLISTPLTNELIGVYWETSLYKTNIIVPFQLTAIMIISIGMTIQTIYSDFEIFIDDHFMSPPTLLVAIGILLLFVSSFGCVGAIKESTMLINIVSIKTNSWITSRHAHSNLYPKYGLLLGCIFILEVAAAIAAFALHNQIPNMLLRTMTQALEYYDTKDYVRDSVDFMQEFVRKQTDNYLNEF